MSAPPRSSSPAPSGSARAPVTVPVWDPWLRLFHWGLALAVIVAWFSATINDALHQVAGYAVVGLLGFRIVWGIAGPPNARFKTFARPPRAVLRYLGGLARGQPKRHLGHNPAGAVMAVALLTVLAIVSISGWMQLTYRYFGVAWVQDMHAYSAGLVMVLVIAHVAGVLLMCALHKENLVIAMISGRKKPDADLSSLPSGTFPDRSMRGAKSAEAPKRRSSTPRTWGPDGRPKTRRRVPRPKGAPARW